MKNRIQMLTTVSMANKPEMDEWMALRKKAVKDMPDARAHHAGAMFGAGLFIHGGLSGEGHRTFRDWSVLDFGLQVWINCPVTEVFHDGSEKPFDYANKYHSLTPVVEPNLTNGRELTRLMWACTVDELIKRPSVAEQGFYMFGGINEEGHHIDDLFWIAPDIKGNSKVIDKTHGEFKMKFNSRPEVKLIARRVRPEGRGPIARAQHSATFFRNQLVIFGGRNDAVFPSIKNVALNDLHIYDVALNRWSALALYGDILGSRWGHRLVSNQNKIVLFGGMNLTSYCESVVYDIHIDDSVVIDYLSKPITLLEEQKDPFGVKVGSAGVAATARTSEAGDLKLPEKVTLDDLIARKQARMTPRASRRGRRSSHRSSQRSARGEEGDGLDLRATPAEIAPLTVGGDAVVQKQVEAILSGEQSRTVQ